MFPVTPLDWPIMTSLAPGGRRHRLKAWATRVSCVFWHRHHPSIIFPSSSHHHPPSNHSLFNHSPTIASMIPYSSFTFIYCIIPALAISFHSVVTSATSWQWLSRCFFFCSLVERVNQVLEHWMKAFEMAPRWNRVQEQRQWHFWHLFLVGPFGF